MNWKKTTIRTSEGKEVEAQSPFIISASRSTDIPAFYSDWLLERLNKGYLRWKNPFNGTFSYVSFNDARLIVFWSKNPKAIISHIDEIKKKIPNFYFQFTLNDYDNEKLEPNVPPIEERIETFIKLSNLIGKEKVIWRFDPLILTSEINTDNLLQKIERIGNKIKDYTKKFVFSFADIKTYKKVQNNLRKQHINYFEFNERLMNEMAQGIADLNKNWNLKIATCAEEINLERYKIEHNKCIDDNLISELFYNDKKLMEFLGITVSTSDLFEDKIKLIKNKNNKDKGQREHCGCIVSKDIGQYDTCPHMCEYCYANNSKEKACRNFEIHKSDNFFDTIIK